MPEILELNKKYGKFTALESLSMNITENSIFGFGGTKGGGKTKTIKIIGRIPKGELGSI